MKLIDLSVSIENSLPVDPKHMIPEITYLTHKDEVSLHSMRKYFPTLEWDDLPDGQAWANERIKLTPHTGTHMDAPWHYHPTMNGGEPSWSIDEIPLEWCFGNGVMADFSDRADGDLLGASDLEAYFKKIGYELQPGDIFLLHTSAPEKWGTSEYLGAGCGIGREGTLWLCERGVHTVGTDAWSWDVPLSIEARRFEDTGDRSIIWEGHKAGRECAYLQMEKLTNLDKLPAYGFKVAAFPIKIKRASAGWVRAVAMVD